MLLLGTVPAAVNNHLEKTFPDEVLGEEHIAKIAADHGD